MNFVNSLLPAPDKTITPDTDTSYHPSDRRAYTFHWISETPREDHHGTDSKFPAVELSISHSSHRKGYVIDVKRVHVGPHTVEHIFSFTDQQPKIGQTIPAARYSRKKLDELAETIYASLDPSTFPEGSHVAETWAQIVAERAAGAKAS